MRIFDAFVKPGGYGQDWLTWYAMCYRRHHAKTSKNSGLSPFPGIGKIVSGRLLKSTAIVGGNTLISRLLGLARDIVIARLFGAAAGTDAFFVAFKIPNFFRRLFAEGAFSQAFVPVLSETRVKQGEAAVQELVARTSGTLGGVLLLVMLLGILAAPVFITIFAPGFVGEGGKFELSGAMLRVTFPYLMFISLTALAAGILNSYGRFAVPAFTPVFLNLCLIAAAIWLAPYFPEGLQITALAWGVLLAGAVQLLFQLPFLARLRMLQWPRWGWHFAGVRKIMRLMLPAIVGTSMVQINLLIDTIIASFLITGSVTWLYYADRMVEFPLGVFGIALATVVLPSLSQKHAGDDPQAFSHTLDWALRLVLAIGLPAALGLGLLAVPILASMFGYEAFGSEDVSMSALALMAYAIGLPAFILVKILASGYYARQDTRTPVRIAVIAMLSNIVMNLAFVLPMVNFGVTGPHAGLALATGLAAWINAIMLYRGLRKREVYRPARGWGRLLVRVLIGLVLMTVVLAWLLPVGGNWLQQSWQQRGTQLGILVATAAAVYLCWLWLSGAMKLLARPTTHPDSL
jgi:putative peptidoglycan lipid II flippase